MFYKKFLFLFMSSLLTCWGIDTPEYKSIAHGDLEKAYPKSWKAAKLFWEAAEEYFDQLNTTQHTNEKNLEQYLQASEKHDEHMTDGDLEKTLQNALEKMGKYLNASKEYFDQLNTTQHTNEKNLEQYLQASEKHDEHMTDGDLEKTLQNALEKMGKYLNASKEYFDQLNTTQHTNEKNLKQFLEAEENFHEQLNKMKKFELKAIKANMKYKNNSDDIQNFEEYKNVSQKLFHEIGGIFLV
ncbi:hypothetical protein KSF78_0004576 [Schistosoma japonicum]|nr:hypothetical protein KSF78_0004576 [Schistosoma japonicum]